jgi:hypothetical protein
MVFHVGNLTVAAQRPRHEPRAGYARRTTLTKTTTRPSATRDVARSASAPCRCQALFLAEVILVPLQLVPQILSDFKLVYRWRFK